MTNQHNDLSIYHKDMTDENTEEFLEMHFISMLTQAKEKKEISLEEYEELIFEPIQTLDEQKTAYTKLEQALLHNRILKGAAYIEEIGPHHKNYKKAMERYDNLVKKYLEVSK